jgi:Sodium Bile acid symporter family
MCDPGRPQLDASNDSLCSPGVAVVKDSNDPGTEINISYSIVAKSVAVFLGILLGASILTQFTLRSFARPPWYGKRFLKWTGPLSLIGLPFTIIFLFTSQGRRVVCQIVSVARVGALLTVYFAVISLCHIGSGEKDGFWYKLGCTQSFTPASSKFELTIAVVIAPFRINSNQSLGCNGEAIDRGTNSASFSICCQMAREEVPMAALILISLFVMRDWNLCRSILRIRAVCQPDSPLQH